MVFNDYRGFSTGSLELGDRLTVVLAGANGSGKSSALAAAADLLSGCATIVAGQPIAQLQMGESNIRAGAAGASWGLEVVHQGRVQSICRGAGEWDRAPSVQQPEGWSFLWEWSGSWATGTGTLPILTWLHSGSTRQVGPLPERSDLFHGRLAAYIGAFDQEFSHFDAFERWYVDEENLENGEKIARGNLNHQLSSLRAVRKVVRTFLKELRGTDLGELRVVRARIDEGAFGTVQGRLTVKKGEAQLFLDQLSDGERRLILLVGDVARRMTILNPHLDDPTTGPGILLADEIDLHLHPGWQRRVMPALRAAFPGLQLIVTTHSPQVLASVPSESVFLIKDFQFLPGHPKTFGRDTNTLLETVFEVPERPEEVVKELRELYEALEDQPKKARRLYNKLRTQLEEDDPELARLETLLELAGG